MKIVPFGDKELEEYLEKFDEEWWLDIHENLLIISVRAV